MHAREIPKTDAIEELARFWDSHDLMNFADQLAEVTDEVFERETAVTVHLNPGEAMAVRKQARARGLVAEELIRQWVREKLGGSAPAPGD